MPYKDAETRRKADALRVEQRRARDRERYHNHPELFVAKQREWRKNNPEREREIQTESTLLHRYGITSADRERCYNQQSGKCANHGCDNPLRTEQAEFGYVDHDHATKKFRGLLCFGCNVSLGHLKDSIPALYGLIEHLRRNS